VDTKSGAEFVVVFERLDTFVPYRNHVVAPTPVILTPGEIRSPSSFADVRVTVDISIGNVCTVGELFSAGIEIPVPPPTCAIVKVLITKAIIPSPRIRSDDCNSFFIWFHYATQTSAKKEAPPKAGPLSFLERTLLYSPRCPE
jgi:hypothetical protein